MSTRRKLAWYLILIISSLILSFNCFSIHSWSYSTLNGSFHRGSEPNLPIRQFTYLGYQTNLHYENISVGKLSSEHLVIDRYFFLDDLPLWSINNGDESIKDSNSKTSRKRVYKSENSDPILRMLIRSRALSKAGRSNYPLQFAEILQIQKVNHSGAPTYNSGNGPVKGTSKHLSAKDPSAPGDVYMVGVLIQLNSDRALPKIPGLQVTSKIGDIITGMISLRQLPDLVKSKQVAYIEASRKMSVQLDKSVPLVGATTLHTENPTVNGAGVVVGVVDTGIDYSHLDFRMDADGDGFEDSSRISYIWDQTDNYGLPPADFPYGTEYYKHQIESDIANGYGPNEGRVREADSDGHGTHIAGIAAGDGSSSPLNLIGVAPKADLIAVKTTFYSADVIDGISYILKRSKKMGKPAAINLSMGSHFGPHDGTSLLEQSMERLLEQGVKALVTSAGNAGNDRIHISDNLNHDSASFSFIPHSSTVYLDFWYPGGSDFKISITPPGSEGSAKTVEVESGELAGMFTPDGDIWVDNAGGGINPNNGDKEIVVKINEAVIGKRWNISITDSHGGGEFNGWVAQSYMGEFPSGDSKMTISEPGNTNGIIAVGAYVSKNEWRGADGDLHHYLQSGAIGDIAPFSSNGPTRDGRIKPDVGAPGSAIASSLADGSKLADRTSLVLADEKHAILQGTSQSAPHVSGTCALLLEADPHMDYLTILDRLKNSTRKDNYTGTVPNLIWGYGKLEASESFNTLGLDISESRENPTVKVGPNPAKTEAYFYYQLPQGAKRAKLIIYNVVGKTVFSTELKLNNSRYEWDLQNRDSENLANGLYVFMIVSDSGNSTVHRLVIRR